MLNLERVMGQERLLRALTGMNIQAFVGLLIPFYHLLKMFKTLAVQVFRCF